MISSSAKYIIDVYFSDYRIPIIRNIIEKFHVTGAAMVSLSSRVCMAEFQHGFQYRYGMVGCASFLESICIKIWMK